MEYLDAIDIRRALGFNASTSIFLLPTLNDCNSSPVLILNW